MYATSSHSQWAKAEQSFGRKSRLQPGDAEAAYRLGTALLEQGKVHEARVEFVRGPLNARYAGDPIFTR